MFNSGCDWIVLDIRRLRANRINNLNADMLLAEISGNFGKEIIVLNNFSILLLTSRFNKAVNMHVRMLHYREEGMIAKNGTL